MLRRREWLVVFLSLVAICVGIYFGKTPEVGTFVTALYVLLVYLQLRISDRQLKEFIRERADRMKEERERRPRLRMLAPIIRATTETDRATSRKLGLAQYVNCPVQNCGGTVSINSQPLVTDAAERTADGRWSRIPDWIHLELRWCLDEIATGQGSPTKERSLVPLRQYQFDLCHVSLWDPGAKLSLETLVRPNAQPGLFDPGEYCYEVRVYSENADPSSAWYLVTFQRNKGSGHQMTVRQADAPPWRE